MATPSTRESVHDELERVRRRFHDLVDGATPADLRRGSDGTRWTNGQLLFHMLLGFFVVGSLLPLVRFLGRRPAGAGRAFAAVLDAGTRPFHAVNHLGACGGALVLRGPRLLRQADRTFAGLHRALDRETEATLALHMPFPQGWDPYFTDHMSVLDVYHYGTVHFEHHERQLTLGAPT